MSSPSIIKFLKQQLKPPVNRIYYSILTVLIFLTIKNELKIIRLRSTLPEKSLDKVTELLSTQKIKTKDKTRDPNVSFLQEQLYSVNEENNFEEFITPANVNFELKFPESISRIKRQSEKGKNGKELPYCYEKAMPKLKQRKDYNSFSDWMKATSGSFPSNEEIYKALLNKKVENGCWVPTDCKTDQYLAVIIPYRERHSNLMIFLYFMHNILQKQRRTYCIIVSEQYDFGQFNRAKLLNVGYIESMEHPFYEEMRKYNPNKNIKSSERKNTKYSGPNCISFHDVDLIPESEKNLFACIPDKAIHQCDKYNKYNYETQLPSGFFTAGGASLIHQTQYKYMNGHANWFWGWGYEDHDMARRLRDNSPPKDYYSEKDFENLNFYEEAVGGLSDKGGHNGFHRQDAYGYYTQLEHAHGFTNGPSGEKLHIAPENTYLAKEMLGLLRDDRVGAVNSNNGTHINRIETKEGGGWDGVDKTTFSIIERATHRFYTRYRADIRLATSEKVSLSIDNKKDVLTFEPEKSTAALHSKNADKNHGATEICNFVHFSYGYADIAHIINDPDKESSLLYHSYVRRWTDGMQKCDDQVNVYHGQCNCFTLQWQKQPLLAPHPLKSSNSSACDKSKRNEVWLRNCPQLGWFQVVPETIILDGSSQDDTDAIAGKEPPSVPKTININLEVEMSLKVFPPIGGLLYLQKYHFEGKAIEEKFVDLGQNMQILKNSPEQGFYKGKSSDGEVETNLYIFENLKKDQIDMRKGFSPSKFNGVKAKLSSTFRLKNALPGFYLMAVRVVDRVGQVYFDMNYVFRLISSRGWDHDEEIRVKFIKAFKRQKNHEEALPMKKSEVYGDFKEKIYAHFSNKENF